MAKVIPLGELAGGKRNYKSIERFGALLLGALFDYAEWRQTLWEGLDVETISRAAMVARKARNAYFKSCLRPPARRAITRNRQ